MNTKVEVVPYNAEWPNIFKQEAKHIKDALGDNCITIHHIGSTAIPNLSAKPIVEPRKVMQKVIDLSGVSFYIA